MDLVRTPSLLPTPDLPRVFIRLVSEPEDGVDRGELRVIDELRVSDLTPGYGGPTESVWREGTLPAGDYRFEASASTFDATYQGGELQRSYAAVAVALQVGGDPATITASVRSRSTRLDNHFLGHRCAVPIRFP